MWTLELTAMPIYPLRWGGSEKSHAGRDLQSRPLRFGPADDLKLEEILRTGQHAPSGEKVRCGTVFSTRPHGSQVFSRSLAGASGIDAGAE